MTRWTALQFWWLNRRVNMLRRKLHRHIERKMGGRA